MGSGASFPERLNEAQCRELVGEAVFDLPTFNKMCGDDGTVSKASILAMADDDDIDIANVAVSVERNGIFFSFEAFDADASGGLTVDEFSAAAKALGYHILPDNVRKACEEIDIDDDGIIDEEEFVKFVLTKVNTYLESPRGVNPTAPGLIFDHLGPMSAQHRYNVAFAILKARPEAARDRFVSSERYKGSDWFPLHYVLSQDVSTTGDSKMAAARARRLLAAPIVEALVKAYPGACSHRCMEGVRFPRGYLPLELAIARGWGATVVETVLNAYPDAATTLDPADDASLKKVESRAPLASLRGLRWMRSVAERARVDDTVLALLPKPKLSNGGKVTWISGQEIAEAEAEKQRKKAEREAKKKASRESKRKKEAEKLKKQEQGAKLKALLERHSIGDRPDAS